jgi:hypothetical protein
VYQQAEPSEQPNKNKNKKTFWGGMADTLG